MTLSFCRWFLLIMPLALPYPQHQIHFSGWVRTALLITFLVMALAGCASRGQLGYMQGNQEAFQGGFQQSVFVATNRQRLEDSPLLAYSSKRSEQISYAHYGIGIPPSHKVGAIEWAKGTPNPKRHFVTKSAQRLASSNQLQNALSGALRKGTAQSGHGKKEVILYVHGYNTNFAEGLYRVAQLRHDYEMSSPMMLFSWPSAGRTGLYVYDRDSIKVSRDALVSVIEELNRSEAEAITLVAHSLGSELLMESLRQLHLSDRRAILSKVNGVILLSPDLDIDVFNSQLDQIKPLPRPFMIFASRKDEALEISSFLTGREERVGNNVDLDKIQHPGVSVIDITDFKGGDSLNHFSVATSPALVSLLKGLQRDKPLEALRASTNQQNLGSQIAGTATLPLRILTKTTQAVFAP